jgi:hypothetical protein
LTTYKASPESLRSDVRPALVAHVERSELERLFPVDFEDVDPLAAAEPSRAALLRLDTGKLIVLEYGVRTETLTISVPEDGDVAETLYDLLDEAAIDLSTVEWMADAMLPEGPFAYAENSPGMSAFELQRRVRPRHATRDTAERTAVQQPLPAIERKP